MIDDRLYLTNIAPGLEYINRDSAIWLYNEGKRNHLWREKFEKEWACYDAESFRSHDFKSEYDFKESQKLMNVDDDYLMEEDDYG